MLTCLGQSWILTGKGDYSQLVVNTCANPSEDRALCMFYSSDVEGGVAVKTSVALFALKFASELCLR